MDVWVKRELAGCEFPDQRLGARLGKILTDLSRKIGATLPAACQDWAATKAAYRFFDNPRVDESMILAGHFAATRARIAAARGPILILHDTTEFSFQRERPDAIGKTRVLPSMRIGVPAFTKCGLLMHSSLAVTASGKPLGLLAIKFWTRKKFKGINALQGRGRSGAKHAVNLARIPIERKESVRWIENLKQSTPENVPNRVVHIGDRESDIFELFCAAEETNTHFLVRTCVDRVAGAGKTTISGLMEQEPVRGRHVVEVFDHRRRLKKVKVEIRFRRMIVHPPIGKHERHPFLALTVLHVQERGTPVGREPLCWKLLTDLSIDDLAAAVEKLDWYAQRWKIETFHKILKSGCKAEDAKLRTATRLTNLMAVLCIIGWRVFQLTMVNRTNPKSAASEVFTDDELELLDRLSGSKRRPAKRPIARYVIAVAKLGGYLARAHDPPPGNMVLWRGIARLNDIHLGYELHRDGYPSDWPSPADRSVRGRDP